MYKGPIPNDTEWGFTFSSLRQGIPSTSRKTDRINHNTRSFNFKRLIELLPNRVRMNKLYPETYTETACALCHLEPEDSKHLWECQSMYAIGQRRKIKENAKTLFKSDTIPCSKPPNGTNSQVHTQPN